MVSQDAKKQNVPCLQLPHSKGVFTGGIKRRFKGSFCATLLSKTGVEVHRNQLELRSGAIFQGLIAPCSCRACHQNIAQSGKGACGGMVYRYRYLWSIARSCKANASYSPFLPWLRCSWRARMTKTYTRCSASSATSSRVSPLMKSTYLWAKFIYINESEDWYSF